jgi:hypothetical protein
MFILNGDRNYQAENAITIENEHAIIQATDCIDKDENPFNLH